MIQLVHETTAAATMYGIDRLDADQDLKVLIYNMGGRDTEVSVVNYSAVTDARNKTYEHVEVLSEAFDETLGGSEFDHVLVKILADKFNSMEERQGKADVRTNARAMKRLYKEGSKIKDILSANKIVDVKVPELLDYVTLQFKLSRDEFYAACEPLFARVAAPVEQALAQAGLTSDQIDQVEILGGGIRLPRIQEILKEITAKEDLHVHMNGDEAMCFGAAFIASNSSSSFKVRKVFLTSHPRSAVKIKIEPLMDLEKGIEGDSEDAVDYHKEVTLYKKSDYLGQRKTINVIYDRAMLISVYNIDEDSEDGAAADLKDLTPIVQYALPDIDTIMDYDVVKKEGTSKPKVSLTFELSRSQIFSLQKAQVSVDELVREEIKPKKVEKEESDSEEDFVDDEDAEKTEKEAEKEEENETPDAESADETETEIAEPEFTEKIVPHTYPVEFDETYPQVRTLLPDQVKDAKKRIKALEKRDENKIKTDEARNAYESLIYEFRGWLRESENEDYVKESDREDLFTMLEAAEDWLYEDGADLGYKEY